ncbi:MAG: MFS transporter [Proteobacteria bacterium]|nr:MFS transporter [Pseudomonadota bacterium]
MMKIKSKAFAGVIVAALGYFVDVYDLLLFNIFRVASLKEFGLNDEEILSEGVNIINMQMMGLLIGGIVWGIIGDKKGRLSVLFGSITIYSIANIINGFLSDVQYYGIIRLIAGFGLAGELGAGITLVSETLDKDSRGIGTTIVACVGVLGAVVAGLIGDFFYWRTAYFIGGAMGIGLLFLRIAVVESGMFHQCAEQNVKRGNLLMLFNSWHRIKLYLSCILAGLPIWFALGILMTFSPEIGRALNLTSPIVAAKSVLYCYIGLTLGDISSGLLSQKLKSRKKPILLFILCAAVSCLAYLHLPYNTAETSYLLIAIVGFFIGYWAVIITTASEQFGTNLRATVTTSIPNFIRGAAVPMTLGFKNLIPSAGSVYSATVVGLVCFTLATIGLLSLHETYGKDLDFIEN